MQRPLSRSGISRHEIFWDEIFLDKRSPAVHIIITNFVNPYKDNNRLKKEIEKLTKQVENASASTSSTSSGDSSGRKRKATDPPEDFSQDKKVRNLQKQLLESKKSFILDG